MSDRDAPEAGASPRADADPAGSVESPDSAHSGGLSSVGWAIGIVPVVLRARTQGLLGSALLVAAATALVWWFAPARWNALATVATATVVGVVLLPPSLGLAMGVFAAAGLLVSGRVGGERVAGDARMVAGAGLAVGSVVVLFTPLVTAPTAVVALALAAALVLHRTRPAWSARLADRAARSAARRTDRALTVARGHADQLVLRWRQRTAVKWMLGVCALVAALGLLLAIRDQRSVLIDDAAITFRYAVRIASGDGFTYNDGDRTNGASAPLYALVLSVGQLVNIDVEAFARALGITCYATTTALVTAVLGRSQGLAAGAVGGVVLLASAAFRTEALTGMESGFAAMLGMLVIYLVMEGHVTWAGVVLGLAIVNKLDAGFLALAVGTACWLVLRRPPWRLAAVAAATAAPWFLFSLLYFGSILPFSATQKLGGEVANESNSHDLLWILRRIGADRMNLLLATGLALTFLVAVRLVRLETRASLALLSCGLWVALHGAAFSLIDLGDPYPWYTTVLFPPLVVSGVLAVFVLADRLSTAGVAIAARGHVRWSHAALTSVLTALLVTIMLLTIRAGIGEAGRVVREGHEMTDFERFEDTRRQGGIYVGTRAEPDEVVESCYGWIAFGALENPFRETCPLSTQVDPGPPTWIVESYLHDQQRSTLSPGIELVEAFESPLGDTFVYRAAG